MEKPREIILSVTNRCNSSCVMCDIPLIPQQELSSPQWKNVIEDAFRIGAKTIVLSGGEPLIREDIFDLISFIKQKGLGACLTSNGLLIDNKVAGKLAKLRIDVVNISLEGPRIVHDSLRGKGSFLKAEEALRNLQTSGIEATVAVTVSRYNFEHLSFIIDLARTYGVTTIKFQPFNPLFIRGKSKEKDFFLNSSQRDILQGVIDEVICKSNRYGIATNPMQYLKKIPMYLTGEFCAQNVFCSALWKSCAINASGDFYPCWALNEEGYLIGNVSQKSLYTLWYSARRREVLDRVKQHGCKGCLMSCYDDIFGTNALDEKFSFYIQRLKQEGIRQTLARKINAIKKKIQFYSSYRGSPAEAAVKVKRYIGRKKDPPADISSAELKQAFEELKVAKELLSNELK